MPTNLCDGLTTADNGLVFDRNSQSYKFTGSYTNIYCPDNNCDNDNNKKISSAFIGLLGFCKEVVDMENLESDKIAEYAILWLGHKLNQNTENGTTTLNEFYTEHIKTNNHYEQKTFGDSNSKINISVIDTKIESMNMNIKDISNFYDAFKLLCKMNNEIGTKKIQCNTCLKNAGEFYEQYEKLKNALDINKGMTKSQVTNCPVTNCPVTNCPVTECQVTECPVTKNTLITIAIIFVAASILLGVSYKYSLFGFRKRSQKQHLREKLKK
ncbi:PIR protein [Plasmodium yoelii yoelii]|uniref:PIR protein n=1 Tax=Plasmodium yoelii yoelii TaxID=73239 RepID=A0AAE9WLB2_PLAYO|nr:PIR protein [Plasmodium yoelii yoelii]